MRKVKNIIMGVILSLIVVLGLGASQVNAASLTVNKNEVTKGEEITVTVALNEASRAVEMQLTYDQEYFKYKSVSSAIALTSNDLGGTVKIAGADAQNSTTYVTYTFEAIKDTDTEEATFVASGLVTESDEELTVSQVSVKVAEQQDTSDDTQNTDGSNQEENNQQGTTSTENSDNSGNSENNDTTVETEEKSALVDEDGNAITKLPQTGTPVIAIALSIAGLALVAGTIIKLRK